MTFVTENDKILTPECLWKLAEIDRLFPQTFEVSIGTFLIKVFSLACQVDN